MIWWAMLVAWMLLTLLLWLIVCRALISQIPQVKVAHWYQESNCYANVLARLGCSLFANIMSLFLMCMDCLRLGFVLSLMYFRPLSCWVHLPAYPKKSSNYWTGFKSVLTHIHVSKVTDDASTGTKYEVLFIYFRKYLFIFLIK